jgi:hypothetical protein
MAELEKIFAEIAGKAEREKQSLQADFDSPFAEITDEDIDRLFSE